ncbi:endonuclease domain-containing protein [Sphingomonas koreensis]|nr:endonuclease domain-containing protein [Sphingomonas koreensis]
MDERGPVPPLPLAGGDRGVGSRFRLGRPTALARALRNNANEIETLLWAQLRRSQLGGLKFSRQMPIAGFVVDFVCRTARLAIEIDGSQHADARAYDARRTQAIEAQGYRVIRFWNSDVLTNIDGVLETILSAATSGEREPTPQPPPASGRGSR